ncbi:hypothetical protein Dimus_028790 [Dionaea muscipula]
MHLILSLVGDSLQLAVLLYIVGGFLPRVPSISPYIISGFEGCGSISLDVSVAGRFQDDDTTSPLDCHLVQFYSNISSSLSDSLNVSSQQFFFCSIFFSLWSILKEQYFGFSRALGSPRKSKS